MRTADLIRALTRLMGAYVLLAGICQSLISAGMIYLGGVGKLDFIIQLGTQFLVYACGWLVLGPILLLMSGPLALFAAKHARDNA